MSRDAGSGRLQFEPLRPATRFRLIVGAVVGPLLWVGALIVSSWALDSSRALAVALLVTFASLIVSTLALLLLYGGRRRQERRYADAR